MVCDKSSARGSRPSDLMLDEILRCGSCGTEHRESELETTKRKPCCDNPALQHVGYDMSARVPYDTTFTEWKDLLREIRGRPKRGELVPGRRRPWGSRSGKRDRITEAKKMLRELYKKRKIEAMKTECHGEGDRINVSEWAFRRVTEDVKEKFDLDWEWTTARRYTYESRSSGNDETSL